MRWFVVLLLLANIFVFAWQYNESLRSRTAAAMEAPRLPPDTPKLTLVSELNELPELRKSNEDGRSQEEQQVTVKDSSETNTFAEASSTCIRTGPFSKRETFTSFRNWLRPRTKILNSKVETIRTRRFFWVYLEPTSDTDAKESLQDLKRKGVTDYMLIRRGGLKNAISLGLFRSQDSVNRRLAEMTEQGYNPVVVPKFEVTDQYWLTASLAQGFDDVELVETELVGNAELLEVGCEQVIAQQ